MDTDYLDTLTDADWQRLQDEQAADYLEMQAAGLFDPPAEQPNDDYGPICPICQAHNGTHYEDCGEWPTQAEKDEYLLTECIAANNFGYTPVEPMLIQEWSAEDILRNEG